MKVKKGDTVIACNVVAWNKRNPKKLFNPEEFYEEGIVMKVYNGKTPIADVLFEDGNVLISGKVSAFREAGTHSGETGTKKQ